MALGRSAGSFKRASCDYEAISSGRRVSDHRRWHSARAWHAPPPNSQFALSRPPKLCALILSSESRPGKHSLPGSPLTPGQQLPRASEDSRGARLEEALTFRPSSVCGLLANTVPTQLGSLNLTKPKPRDWLVVLSFMITQSTTSPYWEK